MGARRARTHRFVGLRRGNRLSRYRAASKLPTARRPGPRDGGPFAGWHNRSAWTGPAMPVAVGFRGCCIAAICLYSCYLSPARGCAMGTAAQAKMPSNSAKCSPPSTKHEPFKAIARLIPFVATSPSPKQNRGRTLRGRADCGCPSLWARHPAPSEGGQREDGQQSKCDRTEQDRAESAEVLRKNANCYYRHRKAQIAHYEIRRDHLTPPLGWGQAVGRRETAYENAADRYPPGGGTREEEAQ
jgi:hypothetical protein